MLDALADHCIEKITARGRKKERTLIPILDALALKEAFRAIQIVTIAAKALLTEVIGDTQFCNGLQPLLYLFIAAKIAQQQAKMVAFECPGAQLAGVALTLEDLDILVFDDREIRLILAWKMNAKPLLCHRMAILEPRPRHSPAIDASRLGQQSGHPGRIFAAFADGNQNMLTITVRLETQILDDHKILRFSF